MTSVGTPSAPLRTVKTRVRRLPTAAGLVVATPTFVAYSYLSSRVNTLMHDMERAGIEIVQMLTETEPESGIISFQPSAESSPRDLRREK